MNQANEFVHQFEEYTASNRIEPLFISGDAVEVLRQLPDESIDFCMTSPPYWMKRQYAAGGIGLEEDYREYIRNLLLVFEQVKRVLKKTGSFWLNIGDSYHDKKQLGIPWRIAIAMMDEQGWVLRNDVVWNKVKGGPDNAKDKLRNVHEPIFHFVKSTKGYYYDVDMIRTKPKDAKVVDGSVISATGVSGIRYRRQIELSTLLTEAQRANAYRALEEVLESVREGQLSDFRMIIKGVQRATHSDSTKLSGRAKELEEKGYYFLKYHPKGSKPSDVWDILPEDRHRKDTHFAPYPEDLCKIPLLSTCPPNGIALDPFAGTGTTMLVASSLGRKSVGIDISEEYLEVARQRCKINLQTGLFSTENYG